MAETRNVVIDEQAVRRAENFIKTYKDEKGIRLTIGNVFAIALDNFIKKEEKCEVSDQL